MKAILSARGKTRPKLFSAWRMPQDRTVMSEGKDNIPTFRLKFKEEGGTPKNPEQHSNQIINLDRHLPINQEQ